MDIYESALKKIENDKKCKPDCMTMIGPTGPTGPTGPQGLPSAKVSVASTETLEPGKQALVYNSGTENDILLNFLIPRGATGPVPQFVIGSVRTVEPGNPAQVNITPIYKKN